MENRPQKGFRDLLAWRCAMELTRTSYLLTEKLPRAERYGLISQIRRAAVSVPANIAEGNGRRTRRDYVSFLYIAQGSLRELETYLLLLSELTLLPPEATKVPLAQLASVARLLNRLIQSLTPPPAPNPQPPNPQPPSILRSPR